MSTCQKLRNGWVLAMMLLLAAFREKIIYVPGSNGRGETNARDPGAAGDEEPLTGVRSYRGQHVAVLERPSPPATTPTTTTTTLDRHRSLGEAAWPSREGATSDLFVNSPDQACDEMWAAWPDKVASALQNKNVILYNVVTSVGNGFLTLHQAIKVSEHLGVGVVANWRTFPGFRAAFDPVRVQWDADPDEFYEHADAIENGTATGLHVLRCEDGLVMLTELQIQSVAQALSITDATPLDIVHRVGQAVENSVVVLLFKIFRSVRHSLPIVQPCAWNMMLSRSDSMQADMARHNPFNERVESYGTWHIRTPDGETPTSYDPKLHPHITGAPPTLVCPAYEAAMVSAEDLCDFSSHVPVFIASTSMEMEANCSANAANGREIGFADTGISSADVHTAYSDHPEEAALNAFLDYLFMMDSSFLLSTGSSFSFTVVHIKKLWCKRVRSTAVKNLQICAPQSCFRRRH